MYNLIRWEPMRELMTLREAMDRLFDDSFTRPLGMTGGGRAGNIPAIDMYQTENDVVVEAALPGLRAENIQINVVGDTLTIRGELDHEAEVARKNYHISEQHWGSFERNVTLPTMVESDKARAEIVDGVLTLTLPKAEQVKPKSITIKTK